MSLIDRKKVGIEMSHQLQSIKVCFKIVGSPTRYIPLRLVDKAYKYLCEAGPDIIVEFFHSQSSQTINKKTKKFESNVQKS